MTVRHDACASVSKRAPAPPVRTTRCVRRTTAGTRRGPASSRVPFISAMYRYGAAIEELHASPAAPRWIRASIRSYPRRAAHIITWRRDRTVRTFGLKFKFVHTTMYHVTWLRDVHVPVPVYKTGQLHTGLSRILSCTTNRWTRLFRGPRPARPWVPTGFCSAYCKS